MTVLLWRRTSVESAFDKLRRPRHRLAPARPVGPRRLRTLPIRKQQRPDIGRRLRRAEQIPCISEQPSSRRRSRCCSVSTPSAVVVIWRSAAMATTACTMLDEPSGSAMSVMKRA
jgi:hypothetical protein